ncbi:MAG: radical SAM protein [Vicinamibacterales bacterium]
MIVFFNPRSTTPGKQPLPLSILQLAAAMGEEAWALVDGNVTADPVTTIVERCDGVGSAEPILLAVTVMPGPQLSQAIETCREVRRVRPDVRIVWGGYFPTQHSGTVLRSDYVDFAVRSQGESALRRLMRALRGEEPLAGVPSLSWRRHDGSIVHNPIGPPTQLDDVPDLPYERVDMSRYIHATCLGRRTVAHHSSFGCPFACSFCAVVAMAQRRWLAQSPARVARVVARMVKDYRVDAVQMHDMDFFISEARVAEIAERLMPFQIKWWALGRIDTLMQYSDRTFARMAASGLAMVFSGAETGSAEALRAMNKGGQASPSLTIELAKRMRAFGIVPEFSFVLGTPPDPVADLERTFEFIRRVKATNPDTEIILYTYTPVPMDAALYREAARLGFAFPETLDEWADDTWRRNALRRGVGVPWLDGTVTQRIRDFERVLNAFYPTSTDPRLTGVRRLLLRTLGSWRYGLRLYGAPYELRLLHRLLRYQRPETTGF